MVVAPKPLARIAEASGFCMADVAYLAGLDESTVCRLWDDPEWLDRVKGRSLQALVGVLPGVGEYILGYSLADRRNRLADRLSEQNVTVDTGAFRRLVQERRIPEQYLSNALETAAYVLNGDVGQAAAHLARFWGREQDYALGFVFGTSGSDALLVDSAPLITAARTMVEQLGRRSNSFHAIVAHANLVHHIARSVGDSANVVDARDLSRNTALAFRSSVIGSLMATNDPEIAVRYAKAVDTSPLLAMVEAWAFPTFTHDAKPTPDFSLPRSLLLRYTATEVIREIEHYNDAYLLYLSQTSIPMIIARDETFGLLRDELTSKLRARRATVVLAEAATACDAILAVLAGNHRGWLGGDGFDQQWQPVGHLRR